MKLIDKIMYLEKYYFHTWMDTRQIVEDELSSQQSMTCLCGRLATGLHERQCSRFKNKVNSETVKRLKELWKDAKNEPTERNATSQAAVS